MDRSGWGRNILIHSLKILQYFFSYRAGQPAPVGTVVIGQQQPANYQQAMAINDWCGPNIFATLCCCW